MWNSQKNCRAVVWCVWDFCAVRLSQYYQCKTILFSEISRLRTSCIRLLKFCFVDYLVAPCPILQRITSDSKNSFFMVWGFFLCLEHLLISREVQFLSLPFVWKLELFSLVSWLYLSRIAVQWVYSAKCSWGRGVWWQRNKTVLWMLRSNGRIFRFYRREHSLDLRLNKVNSDWLLVASGLLLWMRTNCIDTS